MASRWRRRLACLGLLSVVLLHGGADAAGSILCCPNGDRIEGTVVERTSGTVVFQSKNFGRLVCDASRVTIEPSAGESGTSASSAQMPATKDPATLQSSAGRAPDKKEKAKWDGRAEFGFSHVDDNGQRDSLALDLAAHKKWTLDEVRLESHYEYKEDLGEKTAAHWQHSLSSRYFSVYRVTDEWNQHAEYAGHPISYFLVQQGIGAGITFWEQVKAKRTARLGFAENIFQLWDSGPEGYRTKKVESFFFETHLELPFDVQFNQRGVLYCAASNGKIGAENTLELRRKLTEKTSVGLKQEYRHDVPDVRVQNYANLRLFFGVDF